MITVYVRNAIDSVNCVLIRILLKLIGNQAVYIVIMFQFGSGFNFLGEMMNRPFVQTYECYSVSMLPGNERHDVEKGGKIIMPPSALDQLTRLNVEYPMLFKLTNQDNERQTHAGVLEFVADEGKVYLPHWMMHNLFLEEGGSLKIESVSLPVATFSKFQPQTTDFLDITNPKAVLENALRNFACLTANDLIGIRYNSRVYELRVLETKPGNAVTIIECDMNVEFAAPCDYKEPERPKPKDEPMAIDHAELMPEETGFVEFAGTGNRLDGKKKKDVQVQPVSLKKPYVRGIPDYNHPFGLLKFDRSMRPAVISEKAAEEEDKTFKGEGFSLRRNNK